MNGRGNRFGSGKRAALAGALLFFLFALPVLCPAGRYCLDKAIIPNTETDYNRDVNWPTISESAFIHPKAALVGDLIIGASVMICPQASLRGDQGHPIYVGDESNIQDGVVIASLPTEKYNGSYWELIDDRRFDEDGIRLKRENEGGCAVYIGNRVSLFPGCIIYGPAYIANDCCLLPGSIVFDARLGDGCFVEPGAVIVGVSIPPGRLVAAGQVIQTQDDATALPAIPGAYRYAELNEETVYVHSELAAAYNKLGAEDINAKSMCDVETDFNQYVQRPIVPGNSWQHPLSSLIGFVQPGDSCFIAPQVSLRGDVGYIRIGDSCSLQDGVLINSLRTEKKVDMEWTCLDERRYSEEGDLLPSNRSGGYAVRIGDNTAVAPGAIITGPAYVGQDSYIMSRAILFDGKLGSGVVLEPGAIVFGASIPENRRVPAGTAVTTQSEADALPEISAEDENRALWSETVTAYEELTAAYLYYDPVIDPDDSSVMRNVPANFNKDAIDPMLDTSHYHHALASLIGSATVWEECHVSPQASVRGDVGQGLIVNSRTNIQDRAFLHACRTEEFSEDSWKYIEDRRFDSDGNRLPSEEKSEGAAGYGVYISGECSLTSGCVAHGPAYIGENSFVGMGAVILNAKTGTGCFIGPGAVIRDVVIPDESYVSAGTVVTDQETADSLPGVSEADAAYGDLNDELIECYVSLAAGFRKLPSGTLELVIATDKPAYIAGDEMTVGVDIANEGPDIALDMYIAVKSSGNYFFYPNYGTSPIPVAQGVTLQNGFEFSGAIETIQFPNIQFNFFGTWYIAALDSLGRITIDDFVFNYYRY